jgi:hypothetical protein
MDAALGGIVVLHWVAISAFPHWWGGYSIGPRFFTDVIPYLLYFLLPVIAELGFSRGIRRAALATIFSLLLAKSFYAHHRSANSWRVPGWNETPVSIDKHPERVWDWSDIQFLRRGARR